jgi:hypothetical protein
VSDNPNEITGDDARIRELMLMNLLPCSTNAIQNVA